MYSKDLINHYIFSPFAHFHTSLVRVLFNYIFSHSTNFGRKCSNLMLFPYTYTPLKLLPVLMICLIVLLVVVLVNNELIFPPTTFMHTIYKANCISEFSLNVFLLPYQFFNISNHILKLCIAKGVLQCNCIKDYGIFYLKIQPYSVLPKRTI